MRSLRSEILSTAIVLSPAAVVLMAFPFAAIGFKAADVAVSTPAAIAFVHLTADQEEMALMSAKASWQTDVLARRRVRLVLGDLPPEPPEEEFGGSLGIPEINPPEPIAYRPCAWAPSCAAAAPEKLEEEEVDTPVQVFSRQAMLEIN